PFTAINAIIRAIAAPHTGCRAAMRIQATLRFYRRNCVIFCRRRRRNRICCMNFPRHLPCLLPDFAVRNLFACAFAATLLAGCATATMQAQEPQQRPTDASAGMTANSAVPNLDYAGARGLDLNPGDTTSTGIASYYGSRFAGRRTASGERFNPGKLTAAH